MTAQRNQPSGEARCQPEYHPANYHHWPNAGDRTTPIDEEGEEGRQ